MTIKLGTVVKDRVTGLIGVAENRAEFMYGCDRYLVQAKAGKDNKIPDAVMIDEPQLEVVEGEASVMEPLPEPPRLIEMGQQVTDPIIERKGTVTGRAVYLNGCSRVFIKPKYVEGTKVKGWWAYEEQVVGKKTLTGKDKIPVAPSANRRTGGPAPSNSKY